MKYNAIFMVDEKNDGFGSFINSFTIKEDLANFKKITVSQDKNVKNIVIMGYATWKSIKRPFYLEHRFNIVITSQKDIFFKDSEDDYRGKLSFAFSLREAFEIARNFNVGCEIFVIGGARTFDSLRDLDQDEIQLDKVYMSLINFRDGYKREIEFYDTFFDYKTFLRQYNCVLEEKRDVDLKSCILSLHKYGVVREKKVVNCFNERRYLSLVKNLLEGEESLYFRQNRTSVDTISSFGYFLNINIKDSFPLLTTKKIFFRGVFEELMWILRGQSDTTVLQKKNVHIWDGNSSRSFLDSRGLKDYKEGEIGPSYGFNLRHFGGDYTNKENPGGIDQLQYVISEIKDNPSSRRILFNLWDPRVLDKVALPCCHFSFQFYVSGKDMEYLSGLLTMRSSDVFHGLPFNIASYALLIYLVASVTGKKPCKLNISLGDTHIYSSHVDSIKKQLTRECREEPTLIINNKKENIEDFEFEDVEIVGYNPHGSILCNMVV